MAFHAMFGRFDDLVFLFGKMAFNYVLGDGFCGPDEIGDFSSNGFHGKVKVVLEWFDTS
ncbi:unnamed protein product [Dovyalis caffra]|uniref:Glyceraldehyde-3-phosphate dehydrogenase n=1 Tax=Dovyalis caffra TaxID=77055 RepID=A0AAV1RQH5_9ROSI|nr:unnamed protein product [Dovyalis caffra]